MRGGARVGWGKRKRERKGETDRDRDRDSDRDSDRHRKTDKMAGRDRKKKGEGLDKKSIEGSSIDDGQRETAREDTTSREGGRI